MNQENRSDKKSHVGYYITCALIGIISALIFGLNKTVDEVYEELWEEMHLDVYPIKEEHMAFQKLADLSLFLRRHLDADNFLVEWTVNARGDAYHALIRKIPTDDPVRVKYWNDHILHNYFEFGDGDFTQEEFVAEAYKRFMRVVNGKSKSKHFNSYHRYTIYAKFSRLLLLKNSKSDLSNAQKRFYLNSVINELVNITSSANQENFVHAEKGSHTWAFLSMYATILHFTEISWLNNQCARLKDVYSGAKTSLDLFNDALASKARNLIHEGVKSDVRVITKLLPKTEKRLETLQKAGVCNE